MTYCWLGQLTSVMNNFVLVISAAIGLPVLDFLIGHHFIFSDFSDLFRAMKLSRSESMSVVIARNE